MPKEMHPFVLGAQKHLKGAEPRITMVKPGDDIVTGIRVLNTHGHTPGHVSFEVAGDGGLIIVGDAVGFPAVVFAHPEWRLGFDGIPDLAIANRKALLQRAAADKIKMLGFHWPYPGVGHAEAKGSGFQLTDLGVRSEFTCKLVQEGYVTSPGAFILSGYELFHNHESPGSSTSFCRTGGRKSHVAYGWSFHVRNVPPDKQD